MEDMSLINNVFVSDTEKLNTEIELYSSNINDMKKEIMKCRDEVRVINRNTQEYNTQYEQMLARAKASVVRMWGPYKWVGENIKEILE